MKCIFHTANLCAAQIRKFCGGRWEINMSHLITLIKSNIVKQTRTYRFFMIIGISIFLGFLCVPGQSSGYEIFYLGGARGLYNSAWLGALSAALPVILLWLPGFYLLRSQISEDTVLKIGQMIASSPVSKTRYIYGKLITNFSILMVLQLVFTAAIMVMQVILHESRDFSIMDYVLPLIFVTAPYLLVLASLTILFDVVPFLKNTFGNIAIFIFWLVLSTISIASPGNKFDLFGLGTILNSMLAGGREYFPNLPDSVSFGYYTEVSKSIFIWEGVDWTKDFLLSRLMWVVIAFIITQISVFTFNRFKENSKIRKVKTNTGVESKQYSQPMNHKIPPMLSSVKRSNKNNFIKMVFCELKIMLKGHSLWWYLMVLAVIALTPFATSGESLKWIAVSMLLPMSIWAQMGNREKVCDTENLILSSCAAPTKWLATWFAGVNVALLISLGMFARIIMLSEWNYFLPWIAGLLFVPTLALVLGTVSGTTRLFEAIFIVLMYFGPVNSMWKFDFMGLTGNNAALYFGLISILFCIGITMQLLKEKRLIGLWR